MKIFRTILAVVVGYLVFAVSSMLLLGPIMPRTGMAVVAIGLIALALIGLVVGIVVRAIADRFARIAGFLVGGLIALATTANLVFGLGAEPIWYKLGTLVLTVAGIVAVTIRKELI